MSDQEDNHHGHEDNHYEAPACEAPAEVDVDEDEDAPAEGEPEPTEAEDDDAEPEPVANDVEPEEIDDEDVEEKEETDEAETNGFQFHPAFHGAGETPGLEIWRIEQFEPVKREPKTFGQFYTGDAYIVLKTTKLKGYSKPSWSIHFWLGRNCAQDESGSAALRTVELDEMLGGGPVQCREVQGHESKQFLAYFKKGIRYLEGGVKSGFRHVDHDAYEKRLFRCKGKHTIRVEQVEAKCSSLNRGDVFILDDGPTMYVWIGPQSSRIEKIKAMEMARQIRDEEKAGRSVIKIIDDDWNTNSEFFTALGSKDKVIHAPLPDEEENVIRKEGQDVLLYSIFEERWMENTDDGKANYIEVSTRPLTKDLLNSENCYVMEVSTNTGVFLWTGKDCSNEFKKKVWNGVHQFTDQRGYPDWVTITRCIEGAESPLFTQYFDEWHEVQVPVPEAAPDSNVAEQSYEGVDGEALHSEHIIKTEEFVPDEEGEGHVQVWRVSDYELLPVNEKAYGVFFGGDSYVIQYDFIANGAEQHIVYFWQGLNSTPQEQGSAALHAMRIDDELGGEAIQIRVVMNKEPAHFMKIFKDRLIVFMHGHVDGFEDLHNHAEYDPSQTIMFHIRGQGEDTVKAFQVVARGASLNSNDVFLVAARNRTFIWHGKYCAEQEIELANKMADIVSRNRGSAATDIEEGSESPSFWNALGGEETYHTGPKKEAAIKIPPRLFHCSNSSGRFVVEAVPEFDMEDLLEDDVMILDTYDEIFIWIGKGASEFEKKESYKTAYTYINSDPSGRTAENTLIIVVRQGFEPPSFTGHFVPWDCEKWNKGKTFAELVEEIGRENVEISSFTDEVQKYLTTYSYADLKKLVPPEGVDVTKRESYLSDEDFEEIMGMQKDEFYALPKWKQNNKKKEVSLF